MIAAGAPIGLDRAGRRDGTDFVLVAIGPELHPAQCRRLGQGPLPAWRGTAPNHPISLVADRQNSRYSSLSIPRILS